MNVSKIVVMGLSLLALGARAGEVKDTKPDLVSVGLSKAWVPVGFDDNDQAQIVVSGIFPSTCYKTGPYTVKQIPHGIEISQLAYVYKGKCLQIAVPFSQVIDLGLLAGGRHSILDAKTGARLGEIGVAVAKDAAVDDHLYAPVSSAMITREPGSEQMVLNMVGVLPSKSIRLKEVRVSIYPEVVVVQPIAETIPGFQPIWKAISEAMPWPHFHVKKVLTGLPKGVFLLHIRSLNGKAINELQNFDKNEWP